MSEVIKPEMTQAEAELLTKKQIAETKKHLKTLGKNELIRIVLGTLMQLQYTASHLEALKAKYLPSSEEQQKKEEKMFTV